MAPRGAQDTLHIEKPHSSTPLGPPIGETFFGTSFDFSVFFGACFLEGRFGKLPGSILNGFWVGFGRF